MRYRVGMRNRKTKMGRKTIQARNLKLLKEKLHKNALKINYRNKNIIITKLTFQSHCNAVHGLQSILTPSNSSMCILIFPSEISRPSRSTKDASFA